MWHSKQTILTLIALALAAALAACGSPGGETGRPGEPINLDDTRWVLTSLNGHSSVENLIITLTFGRDGVLNGFVGCDYYDALYTAIGGDFAISERGIARVDKNSDTSESARQQKEAYFEALQNATVYRAVDGRLEFENAAGKTTLTFAPKTIDPALDDTEWVLVSLNGNHPLEDSHITLNFGDGAVGGFAGCNRYGGEYAAADEGDLAVPMLWQHLQACTAPEGVMEQEETYIEAIRNAAAYRVSDDRLEIEDAAGEMMLVFTLTEQLPMNPDRLVGTAWQLVSMDGQPVKESAITLAFYNEGQLSGQAGCRGYVGGYQANGDDIRLYWLAMMGTDTCLKQDALMAQEGEYTTHLESTSDYRLTQGQLELLTVQGKELVFEPLPEDAQAGLEGTIWRLAAFIEDKEVEEMAASLLRPTDLLAGTEITATFEDGTARGSAGCNTYEAAYARDGSFLTFEALAVTEMACIDPAGIMEQEQRYLGFLKDVTAHHIVGRQLWLEIGDGRILLFTTQE